MPQCKKANCREIAVAGAPKQYCASHLDDYRRKHREYEAIRVTLRSCHCCGEKLSKTRNDAGERVCGDCARSAEMHIAENRKKLKFENASTVDELKDWLREYLIK